jgi:hypothetical protein
MGQCEASPTDLFTERAAWEDREAEHAEHRDDGGVDCWGGAAEQAAQAERKGSQQRKDQLMFSPEAGSLAPIARSSRGA